MTLVVEQETFTIQEIARRSGFSEPTLRYYERIGLIGPVPRDESSGYRVYDRELARTIESLACLRSSGMSIEDMRSYLAMLPSGNAAASGQHALFASHATRVSEQIAALEVRRRYLQAKADLWAARLRQDTKAEQRATDRAVAAIKDMR